MCNLAYNTRPLDVMLGDGRVIFTDVRFKEVTSFKRMRPGQYQLLITEADLVPTPYGGDIEADSGGVYLQEAVPISSLYLNIRRNGTCTAYILSRGPAPEAVQTMLVQTC